MKLPFVWRRTAEANEQAWKERVDYWRGRAETAERSLATEVHVSRITAKQFSDLFDQHQQLTHQHAALIAQPAGFDTGKARVAAERIARLQRAVARARSERTTEARRANRLQQRLDDAVGLTPGHITSSGRWQPGYQKPKGDAS